MALQRTNLSEERPQERVNDYEAHSETRHYQNYEVGWVRDRCLH
jgi:hypothetical protein